MSMLDRRSRSERRSGAQQTVPTSTGADEETVRIATKDFRRRRRALQWAARRRAVLVWLALVLVLALVAAGAWVVLWSNYVTVRGVEVTGNSEVGRARVERAAAVPIGTPLARVDLAAIRARVEAIPAVRRAEVSRSWPHRVHVAVTERVPVAVVNRGDGLEALDADGAVFGSYATRPRGLALVRTQPDTPAEALAEGGKVVGALPHSVASKLDTIEVDSVDKITLLLKNGKRVVWGSAEDSVQKAEVLAVLLHRPGQVIDVSVPGRPTTR